MNAQEAAGRKMMEQFIGQKVPVHAGGPDGEVLGEALITGVDWERGVFLADFSDVCLPADGNLYTNVTEEAHR